MVDTSEKDMDKPEIVLKRMKRMGFISHVSPSWTIQLIKVYPVPHVANHAMAFVASFSPNGWTATT